MAASLRKKSEGQASVGERGCSSHPLQVSAGGENLCERKAEMLLKRKKKASVSQHPSAPSRQSPQTNVGSLADLGTLCPCVQPPGLSTGHTRHRDAVISDHVGPGVFIKCVWPVLPAGQWVAHSSSEWKAIAHVVDEGSRQA